MDTIGKVGVIGAGVMGAGIAAHMANAGVPVVLLDIVPEGAEDAVAKMLKAAPAAFMHKRNSELVTPGNLDDDLGLLGDCDWIIEAIVERPDIKQALYRRLDEVRRPGSIVSSNTSTLPLALLTQGMGEEFTRDFLITHFFNPPRYMRLLELVTGPATRPEIVETIRAFADMRLGKGVIDAKDTPGFIANRIGIFWLQCGVVEALDGGISVEEADAVLGRPTGVPKTGVFALLDLVGLDLMPHIIGAMAKTLPAGDMFHDVYRRPELIERMIADGYTGRKGDGGFYRLDLTSGEKVKQAIDLQSGEYHDAVKPGLASVAASRDGGLRALVGHPDRGGRYAWRVLSRTLAYAATLVPAIAEDIVAVDEAMKLGYNWDFGPFELIDQLGPAWFAARLEEDGRAVPELLRVAGEETFYRTGDGRTEYLTTTGDYAPVPRQPGVFLLSDVKLASSPIVSNASASLWDIGHGVACLEFHTKLNAIDPGIMEMIGKTVAVVPASGFKALVIHNDAANFSVGANIGLALFAANIAAWPEIEAMIAGGQQAYKALKYAPFPVVGAPSGMALGGGCEVLLHCDAVQAHAETYMGLVEFGVGLVPAWGGCKEFLTRWATFENGPRGPMPPVSKALEAIGTAAVAKSAAEAFDFLFLRPGDGVTMNRDRLLADAKTRALELAGNYAPPESVEIVLPGPTGKVALSMAIDAFRLSGKASPHDVVVGDALSDVLSGGATDITGTVGEDDLLALERHAIMGLVRHPDTLARIEHMLETGKPLRN